MSRDNRCVYMAHVCCVVAVIKDNGFLNIVVLKYAVCLCSGCDGCCVFCLYCDAWSCRYACMGSMSVSSCTCCMFVSCVHPVAFCMTSSMLMLVEDARGDHIRAGLMMTALNSRKIYATYTRTCRSSSNTEQIYE